MATLRDIALAAGVDKSTVSCVLNGKARQARISVAREAQVIEVARRMNFRVNLAARATRRGSFGCVALLMSTDGAVSTLAPRTQSAIHDALAAHEIHLLFTRLPDDKLTEEGQIPKILRQACADALLINYTDHIPDKMVQILRTHQVPSVWLNTRQPFNCVRPDDFAAGQAATMTLIAKGHKKIAFVNYAHGTETLGSSHYSVLDRQQGYETAMRDAGMQARVIRNKHAVENSEMRSFTRSWVVEKNRPTAILTYGDLEATSILLIAGDLGVSTPGDLEAATFGNDLVRLADRVVPTWIVPQAPLGRRAVELVMQRLANPMDELAPEAIAFKYIDSERSFTAEAERQGL